MQNRLRSGLDGLVRFWLNASGLEAGWCARIIRPGSGPASPRPVSHFQAWVAFFHRWPGSYCAKPALIQFSSGWLCQVLAKRIWSRSKLVCKRIIGARWGPMLLSPSGLDPACFLGYKYFYGAINKKKISFFVGELPPAVQLKCSVDLETTDVDD